MLFVFMWFEVAHYKCLVPSGIVTLYSSSPWPPKWPEMASEGSFESYRALAQKIVVLIIGTKEKSLAWPAVPKWGRIVPSMGCIAMGDRKVLRQT